MEAKFRVQRNNDVFMTLQAVDKGLTQYVKTDIVETNGIPPNECPLQLFKTALKQFAIDLADNIDNKRPQDYSRAGTNLV